MQEEPMAADRAEAALATGQEMAAAVLEAPAQQQEGMAGAQGAAQVATMDIVPPTHAAEVPGQQVTTEQ